MIKYIDLAGLFDCNYCQQEHCIHNIDSTCTNENYISEFMDYENGDEHATCNGFEVEDGYCEYCGAKLEKDVDIVECWGAMVGMDQWYCPNGC